MRIEIEAEFTPDEDDKFGHLGPKGLQEALMEFGLFDIDITTTKD